MTSPSPARSKTTPSSGKLSAGRIVKEVPETQEDRFIVPRFHLLGVADGLPLPLTLLVRAILLLRTSFTMLQSSYM